LRDIETRRRQHVAAQHGDTIARLAARLLPGDELGERKLAAWNLHLMLRRDGAPLLGTDIVYLEPPLP
jgi:hypothetical protein